jgi:hypothetical protein
VALGIIGGDERHGEAQGFRQNGTPLLEEPSDACSDGPQHLEFGFFSYLMRRHSSGEDRVCLGDMSWTLRAAPGFPSLMGKGNPARSGRGLGSGAGCLCEKEESSAFPVLSRLVDIRTSWKGRPEVTSSLALRVVRVRGKVIR